MSIEWNGAGPSPLRLLGLDVGDRRIGIAVSDPTGSLATPVAVYHRRDRASDIRHMARLVQELEASGIIVGLPKNMNGTEGPQAEKTREFALALTEAGLTVALWDERLSTVEATRRLVEAGRKGKSIRQRIDSEAAALILESYLDFARMRGTM